MILTWIKRNSTQTLSQKFFHVASFFMIKAKGWFVSIFLSFLKQMTNYNNVRVFQQKTSIKFYNVQRPEHELWPIQIKCHKAQVTNSTLEAASSLDKFICFITMVNWSPDQQYKNIKNGDIIVLEVAHHLVLGMLYHFLKSKNLSHFNKWCTHLKCLLLKLRGKVGALW